MVSTVRRLLVELIPHMFRTVLVRMVKLFPLRLGYRPVSEAQFVDDASRHTSVIALVVDVVRPEDIDGRSFRWWPVHFAIVILDVLRKSVVTVSSISEIHFIIRYLLLVGHNSLRVETIFMIQEFHDKSRECSKNLPNSRCVHPDDWRRPFDRSVEDREFSS